MKKSSFRQTRLFLIGFSAALNVILAVCIAWAAMPLFSKSGQPASLLTEQPMSYPMEAQFPSSVLNQLVEQSMRDSPQLGSKAAHLSAIRFQFLNQQLVTNAQVFLFGKTLNLEIYSNVLVLNGDVRLDVTAARVSGFNLPVATLFSILHSIDLPNWIQVDNVQQQVWIHATSHPFGGFAVYVTKLDPAADRIEVHLAVVKKESAAKTNP